MTGDRAYLDYNATAPVLACAREAAVRALDLTGNPSSVHAEGRAARQIVEDARAHIATLVAAAAVDVIFTSGGTEAAALALQPAMTGRDNMLLVAAGEHPCVLDGHGFAADRVRKLPLSGDGRLDLAALDEALATCARPVTLALQAANNETGVLQPVAEALRRVRAHGGTVVCDAVQVPGRMALDVGMCGADFLILSGHKMGGAKGAGALVCRSGLPDPAAAMLRGGGQERGLRAGTENVSAIAAFGVAAQWAQQYAPQEAQRLARLRDRFEAELKARHANAVVFGASAPRLPNTSAFAIAGVSAETLLIALDLAGVAVSSGSACSSGKVKPSHVLEAMAVAPQLAKGAVRVSLGHASHATDIDKLLTALATGVARIKGRGIASAA